MTADSREYLMNFLTAMERVVPPPAQQRHSLAVAIEDGYPKLALVVAARDKPRIVYIDEGDLAKPVEMLVTECVGVLGAMQSRKAAS